MYPGERFNAYSHLSGLLLSLPALVMMLFKAAESGEFIRLVSVSVYGGSLLLLYLGSTAYHSVRRAGLKAVLQKVDHCMIYLLIAGSYTPFALLVLEPGLGRMLFYSVWFLALAGIVQELSIGRKSEKRVLSLVIYVVMGWMVLGVFPSLVKALPLAGLFWLALGGVLYSAGIYWFVNDTKIKHGHGIWHLFVLAGSLSQFVCIYCYVL